MNGFTPLPWQPLDYNPNILPSIGSKSTRDFKSSHRSCFGYDETEKAETAYGYADRFVARYAEAMDFLALADPKGKLVKALKGAPIAPKISMTVVQEATINQMRVSRLGGIPDFRSDLLRILRSERDKPAAEQRTKAEILRGCWPRDPEGQPMRFLAELVIRPEVSLVWDYFMETQVDQWNTYAPFSGYQGRLISHSNWTRSYSFFVGSLAPYFDPRMDAAIVADQWFDRTYSDELDYDDASRISDAEYLEIVKEAIPQASMTHMGEKCTWSETSNLIQMIDFDFDFDLICDSNWAGLKVDTYKYRQALRDVLEDKILDGYARGEREDIKLFGKPQSQQTCKRFMSTDSYMRPKMMAPWIGFHDFSHDYTWQLYFDRLVHLGDTTWGKVDGSCT